MLAFGGQGLVHDVVDVLEAHDQVVHALHFADVPLVVVDLAVCKHAVVAHVFVLVGEHFAQVARANGVVDHLPVLGVHAVVYVRAQRGGVGEKLAVLAVKAVGHVAVKLHDARRVVFGVHPKHVLEVAGQRVEGGVEFLFLGGLHGEDDVLKVAVGVLVFLQEVQLAHAGDLADEGGGNVLLAAHALFKGGHVQELQRAFKAVLGCQVANELLHVFAEHVGAGHRKPVDGLGRLDGVVGVVLHVHAHHGQVNLRDGGVGVAHVAVALLGARRHDVVHIAECDDDAQVLVGLRCTDERDRIVVRHAFGDGVEVQLEALAAVRERFDDGVGQHHAQERFTVAFGHALVGVVDEGFRVVEFLDVLL